MSKKEAQQGADHYRAEAVARDGKADRVPVRRSCAEYRLIFAPRLLWVPCCLLRRREPRCRYGVPSGLKISTAELPRSIPFTIPAPYSSSRLPPEYQTCSRSACYDPDIEHFAKPLSEARRVLRPGGWLFAAAICRFAPLLDSLVSGFVDHPDFEPILDGDLRHGQHRNPTRHSNFFTTAYFHRPEELAEELVDVGFEAPEVAGVEGCGWLVKDFGERWEDAARREKLLAWVRRVEREPALLGLSLHLMGSARK